MLFYPEILLMVQKAATTTQHVWNNCKSWESYHINRLAGFLPSTGEVLAQVSPKGGEVRESTENPLSLGLGVIVKDAQIFGYTPKNQRLEPETTFLKEESFWGWL